MDIDINTLKEMLERADITCKLPGREDNICYASVYVHQDSIVISISDTDAHETILRIGIPADITTTFRLR